MIFILILLPLIGLLFSCLKNNLVFDTGHNQNNVDANYINNYYIKSVALKTSVSTLFISFLIFALFDFSNNQFQFVEEYYKISSFNIYLGIDGLSIYFVLLTTSVIPVSLVSN